MQDKIDIDQIVEELFRNAPGLIPRKMFSEIIGGVISVKYFANLDSEGLGVQPRMRIGGKVCYQKDAAIAWLKNRCKIEEVL